MKAIESPRGGQELAKVLHYYGFLEASNEFKIVCPFHEDINASLLINLNEGNFYCFGCAESGDAFRFVRLMNPKLDELKAGIRYYRILKSDKVKAVKLEREAKVAKDNVQALDEATDYYFGLKTVDWRKVTDPVKEYMLHRGFTEAVLNKTKAKLTYNTGYPIAFPMFDVDEFRGWVCRTTNKTIERKRKYLYNEGFSRRNTLVGDYRADVVVLVEGYMDRMKLIQFGLNKVAAILGWKITQQQIDKLKKQGVKVVISALDKDACGTKGTEYLRQYFDVVSFQYPEGIKDAGDLTQETFEIAYKKTKQELRRRSYGIDKRNQKSGKKVRH